MKSIMKTKPDEILPPLKHRDEPSCATAPRPLAASPFTCKCLLVPIDFSDCSKNALRYAWPLAQEHEAALTLLYVVPPASSAGEYGGIDYAQLETSAKASAEKELSRLAFDEVDGEVPVDTLVRVGWPAREIVQVARSLPADLIVISTHGRTGFKHALLGSVAEHVVQRAPCPVLVVRER
jgi:universal stress protein A